MNSQIDNDHEKPGRSDFFYLAALFILILLLYLPQFISGQSAIDSPEKMDITTQWFPGFTYWSNCYREGLFPLWNTQRYGGMPWLIYSHGGMLYIPNLIFYVGFNFLDAVTLSYLFHALLAALGLFILLRDLRLSPLSAFLVALVFSTSGFYFFLQSQLSNHSTIAWLPLFLLGIRRLHARAGFLNFLVLSVFAMMMIFSGDTEGLVSNIIFSLLFIILLLRREAPSSTLRTLFFSGCALGLGFLMFSPIMLVMLELLVHSVRSSQSLFQLEFSGFFQNFTKYIPFMFFPWKYFQDIHPISDFNNSLTPFYLGMLPLLGIILSLKIYRRDRRVAAFWRIAVLMTAYLVITQVDFLAPLLERIPVVGQMATPERSVEQVQLALLIAAGCCFDRFRKDLQANAFKILAWMLAALGAAVLLTAEWTVGAETRYILGALMLGFGLIGLFDKTDHRNRTGIASWTIAILVIADVYLLSLASVPRTDPGLFKTDPAVKEFLDDQDDNYRFITFEKIGPEAQGGDLSGLIHANMDFDSPWGHMRMPMHRYFEFLHIIDPGVARDWTQIFFKAPAKKKLFYTVDLFSPAFLSDRNLPLLDLLAVKYIFSKGISFKFSSPFSLMNEGGLAKGDWLEFPHEKYHNAAFIRDRGRKALKVELPYRAEFESYIHPGTELAFEIKPGQDESFPWNASVRLLASEADAKDMKLLLSKSLSASGKKEFPFIVPLDDFHNRYIKFRLEVSAPEPDRQALLIDARMIRKDAPFQRVAPGPVDIYINNNPLPRAFLAHKAKVASPEETRNILRDTQSFDIRSSIILEKGQAPEKLISWTNDQPHPMMDKEFASVSSHESQEARIKAHLYSPGWLFLSDPLYPGWRVWVDGEESVIYRANYIFRAVYLTEGIHTIIFKYQPKSFRVGWWFSVGSFIANLAMALAFGLAVKARKKR